jgi:hypothetical protein
MIINKFAAGLFIILSSFLFLKDVSAVVLDDELRPYGIVEATAELAEAKSRAEDWVLRLKEDYGSNSEEFLKGKNKYSNAKATIDGWIDSIIVQLKLGEKKQSKGASSARQKAIDANRDFFEYMENLYVSPRGKLDWIEKLVKALTNAGISVWNESDKLSTARRNELISSMLELKWKKFDDIAAN